MTTASGELKLGGMYGQGGSNSMGYNDYSKSQSLYGGLQVNTGSYFWSPEFMVIGISGSYSPMTSSSTHVLFADRRDAIDATNYGFSASLLPNKIVSASGYANYGQSYDTRENLTDLRNTTKADGVSMAIKSKFLPVNLSYTNSDVVMQEISTPHSYNYQDQVFNFNTSHSFSSFDRTELTYNRKDYSRKDDTDAVARNYMDVVELKNNIFLDSSKSRYLSMDVYGLRQRGLDTFDQLRAAERFSGKLPLRIGIGAGYSYFYSASPLETLGQHELNVGLSRQFYESLFTGITGNYNYANQTEYQEQYSTLGFNVNYNKKILGKGQLSASYSLSRLHDERQSADQLLQVLNEAYVLSDNQITMIKLPFVQLSTVVVKDATGTLIYRENIDYLLVVMNNYVEIQRIPGGQIANNSTVYLYYTATQPGNNKYDVNITGLSAELTFFNRLINVYYRVNGSKYVNVEYSDATFLNNYNNIMYGVASTYKVATVGVDINDYQSNLYPYHLVRYYTLIQGKLRRKLSYQLSANYRVYDHLPNNEINRLYSDANCGLSYIYSRTTKMELTAVYTYQHGKDLDLDLLTGRFKLTKVMRSVSLVAVIEAYQRSYLDNEKYNNLSGYIQFVKKFKY